MLFKLVTTNIKNLNSQTETRIEIYSQTIDYKNSTTFIKLLTSAQVMYLAIDPILKKRMMRSFQHPGFF